MINKNKKFIIAVSVLLIILVIIVICIACSKKKSDTSKTTTDNPNTTQTSDVSDSTYELLTTSIVGDTTSTTKATDKKSESTTKQKTTEKSKSNSSSEYAYAYAGFSPAVANMNISEWNLLLVNRDYILPDGYKPNLSEAVKGSGVNLDSRVAPYYQKMYDAAKKDGITLTPVSGYRSVERQKNNFEKKIQKYVNQGYSKAEATQMAAKIILPPGTSEHNAGLAMDIISLDVDFEETKAFKWLCDNAADYGFILRYPKNKTNITKITYEPWHWRYVGETHAKAMKVSGQCLEEYLGYA